MPRPDFFIVGAPKCGTTSLAAYLGQHPEVYMLKGWEEPHYFGSDLDPGYRFQGDAEAYLALFEEAGGYRRVGEKSTWYLYSRNAAREIREFAPDGRIIIMLRDPVDMMQSLHAHNVFRGYEDLEDFEAALAAQTKREAGRDLPANVRLLDHLLYSRVPRYAAQVERYFDAFGREAVHLIDFEDFRRDVGNEFRKVAAFLDIDTGFEPSFRVWNPRKRVRSRRLQEFYRRLPAAEQKGAVARLVLPALAKALAKLNTDELSSSRVRPELRKRLLSDLREDIESLSRLTGRDFSHWTAA